MKKLVCILFLLGWILSSSILRAQDERVVEAIQSSDYIFQGKFLNGNFIKKEGDKNYISYKILVEQVYKDNKTIKEGDTIELISFLPSNWQVIEGTDYITNTSIDNNNLKYPYNEGLKLSSGASYLIFANMNKTSLTDEFNSCLSLSPTHYFDDEYFIYRKIKEFDTSINKLYYSYKIDGFGKEFNSLEEFQNYLKDKGLDITQKSKKKDVFSAEELNNQKDYNVTLSVENKILTSSMIIKE